MIEAIALGLLINGWAKLDPEGHGMTAAEVVAMIDWKNPKDDAPEGYEQVQQALAELATPPRQAHPTAQSVGYCLRKFRRRIVGQRYLDEIYKQRGKGRAWSVKSVVSVGGEPCAADAPDSTGPAEDEPYC